MTWERKGPRIEDDDEAFAGALAAREAGRWPEPGHTVIAAHSRLIHTIEGFRFAIVRDLFRRDRLHVIRVVQFFPVPHVGNGGGSSGWYRYPYNLWAHLSPARLRRCASCGVEMLTDEGPSCRRCILDRCARAPG